jgi:protein-tyrosine phosphatase
MEAAAELCRQINLRQLSGLIVIDFISQSDTTALREAFKQYVREWLPDAKYEMTRSGLTKMTKRKVKPLSYYLRLYEPKKTKKVYPKRIPLSNTHNTRDLGGLPLPSADGTIKTTEYGRLLRGGKLDYCTMQDISILYDYGVRTVIDLRNSETVTLSPHLERKGIEYHNIPIMLGLDFEDTVKYPDSFEQLYIDILENRDLMREVFEIIADKCNKAVLFHCAGGKDRTGVVACLLLMLAGVQETDITADYEVSYTLQKRDYDQYYKKYPSSPPHTIHSKPEWIINLQKYITETYGSAENYICCYKENICCICQTR